MLDLGREFTIPGGLRQEVEAVVAQLDLKVVAVLVLERRHPVVFHHHRIFIVVDEKQAWLHSHDVAGVWPILEPVVEQGEQHLGQG